MIFIWDLPQTTIKLKFTLINYTLKVIDLEFAIVVEGQQMWIQGTLWSIMIVTWDANKFSVKLQDTYKDREMTYNFIILVEIYFIKIMRIYRYSSFRCIFLCHGRTAGSVMFRVQFTDPSIQCNVMVIAGKNNNAHQEEAVYVFKNTRTEKEPH